MGDTEIKSGRETTGQQMQALVQYLPEYLRTVAENVPSYEQRMFNARALQAPQELSLQESLLGYYAPRFANIGSDIQEVAANREAQTAAGVIAGPGADLIRNARIAQGLVDPEYYAGREMTSKALSDLIGSIDISGELTGGERAEVERGLNRQFEDRGTGNVPTSGNAIEAGIQFGGARTQKQMAKQKMLGDILATTPAQLAAAKSGVDVLQQATGRPSYGANAGLGAFNTNPTAGYGSSPTALATGLFGEAGQNVRQSAQLNAQKKDWADYLNQVTSSIGDIAGVAGGFAF